MSVASDGTQSNGDNYAAAISADGRYVTWASSATNLVTGDTNNTTDVFLHDLRTRETSRISVATDGSQADRASVNSSLSADGRYVAFESEAMNLVTGARWRNIFLRDRQTGTTTLVTVPVAGTEFVFASSSFPRLSPDGRYVVFSSDAPNLVPGNSNGQEDVFRRDLRAGTTTIASITASGAAPDGHSYRPSVSADGRHVAFESYASNTTVSPMCSSATWWRAQRSA